MGGGGDKVMLWPGIESTTFIHVHFLLLVLCRLQLCVGILQVTYKKDLFSAEAVVKGELH